MPIVADAAVKIGTDFSTFGRDLEQGAGKPIQTLGQKIKGVLSPTNLAIGAAALGGLVVAGLAGAVKSLIDIERLNAQTDAAIRSTGGVANVSRQHIEDMGESLESLTTIERETVQEAENLLLTFTNVRNEAGAGNDIFDRTTEAVLDMSVALGTDAPTAAMQLGKALNDPVKGMGTLARAGVQFTDQQKEMVAAMVESGDLLGAQKVILKELETQFGGSAEAFAQTTAGKIQNAQNQLGNLFELIIVGAVDVSDALGNWDPLGNIALGFGSQRDRIAELADMVGTDLLTMKERVVTAMNETGDSFEEVTAQMEGDAKVASVDIPDRMSEAVRGMAGEVEKGGPVVAKEWSIANDLQQIELDKMVAAAKKAGEDSITEFGASILNNRQSAIDEVTDMITLMDEALSVAETIAALTAENVITELKTNLRSDDEGLRLAAQGTMSFIITELNKLGPAGVAAAAALLASLTYGLEDVTAGARLRTAALNAAGIATAPFPRSEPKDPKSSFRGITHWGGDIVRMIADDMMANVGAGAAASRALSAVLRPNFGPMAGLATATAMSGGVGGNTYNVNMLDRLEVRRVEDIGAGLKRLDDLGKLPGSRR